MNIQAEMPVGNVWSNSISPTAKGASNTAPPAEMSANSGNVLMGSNRADFNPTEYTAQLNAVMTKIKSPELNDSAAKFAQLPLMTMVTTPNKAIATPMPSLKLMARPLYHHSIKMMMTGEEV